jgi:hypothetical protein
MIMAEDERGPPRALDRLHSLCQQGDFEGIFEGDGRAAR